MYRKIRKKNNLLKNKEIKTSIPVFNLNKMTEDNCRIGDPKVMINTKGAPAFW